MGSRIGLAAATALVVGPLLAYLRLVPAIAGFVLFTLGGLIAVVVGIASIVRAARGKGLSVGGAVALVAGIAFILAASRGASAPKINDFTTDTADPPAFVHAATLPANTGRDMSYPPAFAAVQQQCCADLHPARLRMAPGEAFTRVRDVAQSIPTWTVTRADPDRGAIEAIATSRLFGFHDDVVIRIRPDADGASRVDVRSKSRDGKGDLGVNAGRIRTFVAAIER